MGLRACSATLITTPTNLLICGALRLSFPMSYQGSKTGAGGDTSASPWEDPSILRL
jgi:hypothetical protein